MSIGLICGGVDPACRKEILEQVPLVGLEMRLQLLEILESRILDKSTWTRCRVLHAWAQVLGRDVWPLVVFSYYDFSFLSVSLLLYSFHES